MRRVELLVLVYILCGICSNSVETAGVYFEHNSDYFYHSLEDSSLEFGELKTQIEYPNLNEVAKEKFIIGVDKSDIPVSNKIEKDLEKMFGQDFFEKNKFQLFLALIVTCFCFILCFCVFTFKRAWRKWKSKPRKPFRPISWTDKFLESGLPQETFQFMPLRALSPNPTEFEFYDEDLPDYTHLQGKKIYPNNLYGRTKSVSNLYN